MSSTPTGHEPTAHGHADLEQVQHLIEEAHQAEDKLHQMAPYQLQTEDDYVPNGFDPSDHKPEKAAHADHAAAERAGGGSHDATDVATDDAPAD